MYLLHLTNALLAQMITIVPTSLPLLTVKEAHADHVKQATIVDVQLLQLPNAFLYQDTRAPLALMTQIVQSFLLLLSVTEESAKSARLPITLAAVQPLPLNRDALQRQMVKTNVGNVLQIKIV